MKTNIANSHQFFSGYGFSFTLNADPEPTFHFDADPDPVPSQKMQICDHWYIDPSTVPFCAFTPPLLHFESPKLLNLDSDTDPDPASQNDEDPCGSGSVTLEKTITYWNNTKEKAEKDRETTLTWIFKYRDDYRWFLLVWVAILV